MLKSSSNQIVQFQAVINLLPYNFEKYSKSLLRRLQATTHPAYFYRLLNSINDNKKLNKVITPEFLKTITKLIKQKRFSDKVKKELLNDNC